VTDFWPTLLSRLLATEDLSSEEAAQAMRLIVGGEATPAQVAAFVVALRAKGETPAEVGGMAEVLLELAPAVETPGPSIDTSGTGGDRSGTINVSTLAAIVAAGSGAVVAKHASRAASSRCGSADLLEALGVKIALSPDGVSRCLAECGIGFMFAPSFHPSMAKAAKPRQEMGVLTVFDFLWPVTNPARPEAQLVGVPEERMQRVLAGVLADRGTRAFVVRGDDGVDEITISGPTHLLEARGGVVMARHLLPIEMGVPTARAADVAGGDAKRNASIATALLAGEKGPPRDIVAVNAGAALVLAGISDDIPEGIERAFESIDSGKAAQVLSKWVGVSNRAA
jgi:anthranilate phosphoribosyltransferase